MTQDSSTPRDSRERRVERIANMIAEGVIAWADKDRDGRASRYPIPPWLTYEAIAERIVSVQEDPDGGL